MDRSDLTGKQLPQFFRWDQEQIHIICHGRSFENYVACQIKKYFRENWEVSSQDKNYYLFEKPRDFQLRPDIVMKKGKETELLSLIQNGKAFLI